MSYAISGPAMVASELGDAHIELPTFLLEPGALVHLGVALPALADRPPRLRLDLLQLRLETQEVGRLLLELFLALAIVLPVPGHLLDLAAEDVEHVFVLVAQRSPAGGAVSSSPAALSRSRCSSRSLCSLRSARSVESAS